MLFLLAHMAFADPCGMVPPLWTDQSQPGVVRKGLQQTYVFHKDGVETIAIRPGFRGNVADFGMLIPMPAVPSLRKIDDRTFDHLAKAVDPPKVHVATVDTSKTSRGVVMKKEFLSNIPAGRTYQSAIEVVKTEAVGMYQVAVLQAGSSEVLQRWMQDNQFRYPTGMDQTVEEYIDQGWLFVAVKARMGDKENVQAKPGMRQANHQLNDQFDGFVQGMAFRFRVDEPVIPMRLSVFNGDDAQNRVYVLTDQPVRIDGVSSSLVRRQLAGVELYYNLTASLTNIGEVVPPSARLSELRDPRPHNGVAKDLMIGDLLAVSTGQLDLPMERMEKELLNISEALNLRGTHIDAMHQVPLDVVREQASAGVAADLRELTLTVIDGTFSTRVMGEENLVLSGYELPRARNNQTTFALNEQVIRLPLGSLGYHLP